MYYHSGIGQTKSQQNADSVQVDETINVTGKRDDQQRGNSSQGYDAHRESQAIAAKRELVRHVIVARQH